MSCVETCGSEFRLKVNVDSELITGGAQVAIDACARWHLLCLKSSAQLERKPLKPCAPLNTGRRDGKSENA